MTAEERSYLIARYLRPTPRLALGETLRTYASAALDVSDGLMKDLTRIAGPLGLTLDFGRIPLSKVAAAALAQDERVSHDILSGGDDYELLIAVPPGSVVNFEDAAKAIGVGVRDLGALEEGISLSVVGANGTPMVIERLGYDHFSR